MSGNNGNTPDWVEIRDARGRLLFKYNPTRNEIEIKPRDSDIYTMVRLDEIRLKLGYTPEDMNLVFVKEYVTVTTATEHSDKPYSNGQK